MVKRLDIDKIEEVAATLDKDGKGRLVEIIKDAYGKSFYDGAIDEEVVIPSDDINFLSDHGLITESEDIS